MQCNVVLLQCNATQCNALQRNATQCNAMYNARYTRRKRRTSRSAYTLTQCTMHVTREESDAPSAARRAPRGRRGSSARLLRRDVTCRVREQARVLTHNCVTASARRIDRRRAREPPAPRARAAALARSSSSSSPGAAAAPPSRTAQTMPSIAGGARGAARALQKQRQQQPPPPRPPPRPHEAAKGKPLALVSGCCSASRT